MNRTTLKNYAPQARRDFIQAMTDRAAYFGLTDTKSEPVVVKGDVAVIGGRSFPIAVAKKRKALEDRIKRHGFEQTMEAMAYTWFNRLVAIRFMELHGYLEHGYRVLSHPEGKPTPEILEHAEHVELPGVKKEAVIDLKLAGNKEGELYRLLLTSQCNALHTAMPFLFEKIEGETELLLPDNLLNSDSLMRKLVGEIEEEDWNEVEIIGWLYQFYISEKKDEVIGKVVASEDIPAATQLFTPNWIVKYLVHNTLGRQWLATYPQSALRQQMEYYIEPAEQTPEVQEQLKAITPTSLNPEELTLLDPACGSGHILVEAYDLFKEIYQERAYRAKDIPALILQKNLFGMEIDDRAAQLAAFALMMKARADDRRIFDSEAKPNILAFEDSQGMNASEIYFALTSPLKGEKQGELELTAPDGYLFEPDDNLFTRAEDEKAAASRTPTTVNFSQADIASLLELFKNAKTFGSLIQVPPKLALKLPEIENRLDTVLTHGYLTHASAHVLKPLLQQARILAQQYDAVVANPPYMGNKYYCGTLKQFIYDVFKDSKGDICAAFIEQCRGIVRTSGTAGLVTMQSWMFLSSFEKLRMQLLQSTSIISMALLGPNAFPQISGEVVQVSCFTFSPNYHRGYRGTYTRLTRGDSSEKKEAFRRAKRNTLTNLEFANIPGSPIIFWADRAIYKAYETFPKIHALTISEGQNVTGDNSRFLRLWWEVDSLKIGRGNKWIFYAKGGGFRRWAGNLNDVIDWSEQARRHFRADRICRIIPEYLWYKEGVTWSYICTGDPSFRFLSKDTTFDKGGSSVFFKNEEDLWHVLGFSNSRACSYVLKLLNPTINYQVENIRAVPVPPRSEVTESVSLVKEMVLISSHDWLSYETSFGFPRTPALESANSKSIESSLSIASKLVNQQRTRMSELETINNRLFIDAYGLQDELSPEVPDEQITLYRPDREEDIKRLLSYALGCMMGRYSLDKPGLIYAHSGNQDFDASQYKTFRADDDGIIPLLEADWGIRDDATNRIVEFISLAWPQEHLEENLKFVADSLGPTGSEQPRNTIRRYLSTGFYKHHLSMYKKRPIYWLFSSGKQRAFQCLVYLHRYQEGTLARMRTEYVIPLQGQIAARIEQLEGDKTKATSTSHRKNLQKEQDDLKKQQTELLTFEEKLKHAADQKISLDLDDGVKVNYAKFGDLLAESKAITGGKEEE
jgi:SAM-dependent methyltransferase